MKYISLLILLLVAFLLASCKQSKEEILIPTVVDIAAIAGKGEADVARVLGQPSSSSETKYGIKHSYEDAQIEIVFIDGLADWITIEAMDDVPFTNSAIGSLGLAAKSPTVSSASVIRWDGIAGLREVSIFPLQGKVDYAYVKAKTK